MFTTLPCFVFLLLILPRCQSYLDVETEFSAFNDKYKKGYKPGSREFEQRIDIYKENLRQQKNLNQLQPTPSARYGVTQFSDLSYEEFSEQYLHDLIPSPGNVWNQSKITPVHRLRQLPVPQKLDWRTKLNYSVISPVKNQNQCGACWAFSTVETVESMYSIRTGVPPPRLSVQQVIDCSRNNGCKGGVTCKAMQWMKESKTPIVTESLYPLTDVSNYCKMLKNGTKGILVRSEECYTFVGQEERTIELLQGGPVVVTVDARTWNNYQGGIIQYHCGVYNNHAVQIVGYDLTGDVPYYIVRNSWGPTFGHQGYLYIKIGANVCGIANDVGTLDVYT